MIKEAIAKIIKKENLSDEEMTTVMNEIMDGEATDAQKASFLTALNSIVSDRYEHERGNH